MQIVLSSFRRVNAQSRENSNICRPLALSRLWGAYGLCPKSRAWRAPLTTRHLTCWEAAVTLCLWF